MLVRKEHILDIGAYWVMGFLLALVAVLLLHVLDTVFPLLVHFAIWAGVGYLILKRLGGIPRGGSGILAVTATSLALIGLSTVLMSLLSRYWQWFFIAIAVYFVLDMLMRQRRLSLS